MTTRVTGAGFPEKYGNSILGCFQETPRNSVLGVSILHTQTDTALHKLDLPS